MRPTRYQTWRGLGLAGKTSSHPGYADAEHVQRGRRIEGRKGYGETSPELVRAAKRLTHGNHKQRFSLREISSRLIKLGFSTKSGKPFSAAQVKRLLATK